MMRGMFAAISGLKNHQTMLDVTANNLANVNTVGYKSERMTFADSLSQLQRPGSGQSANSGGTNAAQVGLGTQLGSIDNMMGSGSFQSTGNNLDVAIQGPGFFRVADGVPTAGNPQATQPTAAATYYKRAGNFQADDQGYIVTPDGKYVMGQDNTGASTYIQVPIGATDVAIGSDGEVTYTPPPAFAPPAGFNAYASGRDSAGWITLARFPNEPGLVRNGQNEWTASAQAGAAIVGKPGGQFGNTVSGVLEMSNVDMATEFTTMISAQRGFQANSRTITTADQMLEDLVNIKR